jgi:hypothetical protein
MSKRLWNLVVPLMVVSVLAFAAGFALATRPPSGLPLGSNQQVENRGDSGLLLAGNALRAPQSCADLLDEYVQRGLKRVSNWGWYGAPLYSDSLRSDNLPLSATGSSSEFGQSHSGTGTNVQEIGVDEADGAKTNGQVLVRIQEGNTLVIDDVTGSEVEQLASLPLANVTLANLLLAEDTVWVVGGDTRSQLSLQSRVFGIDISDPGQPTVTKEFTIDAEVVAARMHDGIVRLVIRKGLPVLNFRVPLRPEDTDQTVMSNKRLIRETALEDWVPGVRDFSAGKPGKTTLLPCDSIGIPDQESGLGTTAVLSFSTFDDWQAAGIIAESSIAYFSTDHLYLAQPHWGGWCCGPILSEDALDPGLTDRAPGRIGFVPGGTTQLFDFEFDGLQSTFVAAGEVAGAVADQWSMDEVDGVLRVVAGPTAETGNFNSVLTLRRNGDRLEVIGQADKLGVNETVQSVRWFDDLAVVVTFRQIDPLYAVDLSNPDTPKVLGSLKIPGFSSYLHPLGDDQILGIGQAVPVRSGAPQGAQAGLFDLSDPTQPTQSDVVLLGRNTTANAGLNPHQFTWLPEQETALTVVTEGWSGTTAWVAILTIEGDQLRESMVEVEYGNAATEVRMVPVANNKVILVTGNNAEFLSL